MSTARRKRQSETRARRGGFKKTINVEESRRNGSSNTRPGFKETIKNVGLGKIVGVLGVLLAGAATFAYHRHRSKTIEARSVEYQDEFAAGSATKGTWTIMKTVRPTIKEDTINPHGAKNKIVVVDWVLDAKKSARDPTDPAQDTLEYLSNALENPESKLVILVRHPFSCANEASLTPLQNFTDGFYQWWWSNPPATSNGLLQAFLHAKVTFANDTLQEMLKQVATSHGKEERLVPIEEQGPLQRVIDSIGKEPVLTIRSSPMFRAVEGAAAIASTRDDGKTEIILESSMTEKHQPYDKITGPNVQSQNKLVPQNAYCMIEERLKGLFKLKNITTNARTGGLFDPAKEDFISPPEGESSFEFQRRLEENADPGKLNVWATHGGLMKQLLDRSIVRNNEAVCVLMSKGHYDPSTLTITDRKEDNDHTIIQIVATAKPMHNLGDENEKEQFLKDYEKYVHEIEAFLDDNPTSLDNMAALLNIEDDPEGLKSIITDLFGKCPTYEVDKDWLKKCLDNLKDDDPTGGIIHQKVRDWFIDIYGESRADEDLPFEQPEPTPDPPWTAKKPDGTVGFGRPPPTGLKLEL